MNHHRYGLDYRDFILIVYFYRITRQNNNMFVEKSNLFVTLNDAEFFFRFFLKQMKRTYRNSSYHFWRTKVLFEFILRCAKVDYYKSI